MFCGKSVIACLNDVCLVVKKAVLAVLSSQNMHSFQVPSHADEIPFTADGFHPSE